MHWLSRALPQVERVLGYYPLKVVDSQTVAPAPNISSSVFRAQLKTIVMQSFLVSILTGCVVPALPIVSEYGLTNAVRDDTWSLIGIVYVAFAGVASRNKAMIISSFLCSTLCAVIYIVSKYSERNHVDIPFVDYTTTITQAAIYLFGVGYVFERFGRHVIEKRPIVSESETSSPRISSQLKYLLFALFLSFPVIVFCIVISGLNKIDNPIIALMFILTGLPLILIVMLDVIDRVVALRELAQLFELLNEDDMAHMLELLNDSAGLAMAPHTKFEAKWASLAEFLNFDYFGRIASRALFQPSHKGRLRYFERARIIRLRFRDRATKGAR
jgi:uncharacterized membrane protein